MKIKPITVALVDDDAIMCVIFRNVCESHGMHILLEARNGQDLLNKLQESATLPDTCLLDISMPIMNGYETAVQLKTHYPSIKILAYSSNNDPSVVEKIIFSGAHRFLEKGLGVNDYVAALVEMAG